MHQFRVVAAAVAVTMSVSLVAGACGGDDDSVSNQALSKSEFKQKTDAACEEFSSQLQSSLSNVDASKATDAQVQEVAGKAADALHSVADKLRGIGYPEGLQDEAQQFYDGLDKAADALENDPNVLKTGDTPKEFSDLDKLSAKLDITNCGQGG
jgi:hypothetical protein